MLSFRHQNVDVTDTMPCFSGRKAQLQQTKRLLQRERQAYSMVPVGDAAYLITFADHENLQARLLSFREALERSSIPGVIEAVIGLQNVLVHCDPGRSDYDSLQRRIKQILAVTCSKSCGEVRGKHWQIPICYDADFAIDLREVAARCEIQETQLVWLHSQQTYTVSMTGFMPGQPYLAELPEVLRLPRRSTPRVKVDAGSVAIASAMTVIYPSECPAGWHVIGRTPVSLFDASANPPATLAPGDRVRFEPLLRGEYDSLASAVASNEWRLEHSR